MDSAEAAVALEAGGNSSELAKALSDLARNTGRPLDAYLLSVEKAVPRWDEGNLQMSFCRLRWKPKAHGQGVGQLARISDDEMTPEECLQWLQEKDIEGYGLPRLVEREIQEVLERASPMAA
jgi:hypothetical protein